MLCFHLNKRYYYYIIINNLLKSMLVHTAETVRVRYFLEMFLTAGVPLLLAGPGGCGKTALLHETLSALPEDYLVQSVPCNFYTTSGMF